VPDLPRRRCGPSFRSGIECGTAHEAVSLLRR
jgi:hypothetical protein